MKASNPDEIYLPTRTWELTQRPPPARRTSEASEWTETNNVRIQNSGAAGNQGIEVIFAKKD